MTALSRAPQAASRLIAILSCVALCASGEAPRVVIVYTSGVQAYAEALEGIREAMSQTPGQTAAIDLNSPERFASLQQLRSRANIVIIAVGADALQALAEVRPAAPVVSTMMLHENEAPQGAARSTGFRPAASVHLDLAVPALAAELNNIFPGKKRLGVIRNSARVWDFDAPSSGKAAPLAFTVRVSECSQPEDLLPALLSLKGKVDFVLVLPDSSLYNSATVKPLVLASIRNRLPVIGFSASFVRSGAAIGMYPDFRDIGRQTAELAENVLAKRLNRSVDEGPKKWIVAINQRTLRLLGLEHRAASNPELVLFR